MKLKYGAVSYFSYKQCPVAIYAEKITNVLSDIFETHCIESKNNNAQNIAEQVREMDIVEIHMEFGIFGDAFDLVLEKLKAIIDNAKKIVITVHSLHCNDSNFFKFYCTFYNYVALMAQRKAIAVIVNNYYIYDNFINKIHFPKELIQIFPILYFSENEITNLKSNNVIRDRASFLHDKIHFTINDNDVILGYFGFIQNPHKDYVSCVKALSLLPENYKLLIVGTEHILDKRTMVVSKTIKSICKLMDSLAKHGIDLKNRIAFINDTNNDEFAQILASVDFNIINYLEVEMSFSSMSAQALQLSKKIITSTARTFLSLDQLYPDCFEMIEHGNYYQLYQKILKFQEHKMQNLEKYNAKWSYDSLIKIYQDFVISNFRLPTFDITSALKLQKAKAKKSRLQKFKNSIKKRYYKIIKMMAL